MKRLLLLFYPVLIISCSSVKEKNSSIGKGSYRGNVFWKYNNYIGNKPDAGASIKLIGLTDSSRIYYTTADVRGDYSFDSIPEGSYISIIESKNTKGAPSEHVRQIDLNKDILKKITKFDFQVYEPDFNAIKRFDSLRITAYTRNSGVKAMNEGYRYEDSVEYLSKNLINKIPDTVKSKIKIITPMWNKVQYELIYIEPNKTENLVTDFGITYW